MKIKALDKCLRRYVEATSDYPDAMQTYDSTVLAGKITTVHALHREYKCNHTLVTGAFETEKPVYVDDTTWQQEIASRRYLFANTSAEKEDEVYPVTVKEVTEAQRAHNHYAKYFKDSNKTFKNKDSHISIRTMSDELVLVYKGNRLVIPTSRMQNKVLQWYHHYLTPFFSALESGRPDFWKIRSTLFAVLVFRIRAFLKNQGAIRKQTDFKIIC